MTQSSTTLHEADLPPQVVDRHRAVVSLMEELEAVDWYDQRAHACSDAELETILAHNRDEEKEHAVMLLEWLRRSDPKLDAELKARLFGSGPIAQEQGSAGGEPAAAPGAGSLGIGSLKTSAEEA
jgi:ferritin-like protein